MKKTLLTLSIASLAASAFAGTVYNYDSATSTASLNLDTSVKYSYNFNKNAQHKVSLENKEENGKKTLTVKEEPRFNTYSRTNKPSASFTVSGFGQDKETGFLVGFGTKVKYSYDYTKSQTKTFGVGAVKDTYSNPEYKHTNKSKVSMYFGTFGSDKMGYFTLGNTDTLVHDFFSPMGETVELLSVDGVKDHYKTTARYNTPEFYGVHFATTFGRNDVSRQFALAAKFNAYGADVSLTGFRQVDKGDKIENEVKTLINKTVYKGINLELGYSMFGASAKLAASYQVKHPKASSIDYNTDTYLASNYKSRVKTIGFELAYTDFEYVQPYFGLYYSFKKDYNFEVKPTQKSRQKAFVVGAKSNLFAWSGISASAYLEGSYSKTVTADLVKETTKYHVKRVKAFETGVEFKF